MDERTARAAELFRTSRELRSAANTAARELATMLATRQVNVPELVKELKVNRQAIYQLTKRAREAAGLRRLDGGPRAK